MNRLAILLFASLLTSAAFAQDAAPAQSAPAAPAATPAAPAPTVNVEQAYRREFALLPSPVLEDMLRTMRLSPSPVEFEMTGRVFIYKGRNFLLA